MKEVIMKLTSDHIKVKGGEYVQDLVRCRYCKHYKTDIVLPNGKEVKCINGIYPDDFCSYGERKESE